MICRERGCNQIIDLEFQAIVKIKGKEWAAYPCCGCKRLHFRDGTAIIKKGKKIFLRKSGPALEEQKSIATSEIVKGEIYKIDRVAKTDLNRQFLGKKLSGIEVQVTKIRGGYKKGYVNCSIAFQEDVVVNYKRMERKYQKGNTIHFWHIRFKEA